MVERKYSCDAVLLSKIGVLWNLIYFTFLNKFSCRTIRCRCCCDYVSKPLLFRLEYVARGGKRRRNMFGSGVSWHFSYIINQLGHFLKFLQRRPQTELPPPPLPLTAALCVVACVCARRCSITIRFELKMRTLWAPCFCVDVRFGRGGLVYEWLVPEWWLFRAARGTFCFESNGHNYDRWTISSLFLLRCTNIHRF